MTYPFEDTLDPEEKEFLSTLNEKEKYSLDSAVKKGEIQHPNDLVSMLAALEILREEEDDDGEEDGIFSSEPVDLFSPKAAEKIGEKDGKPIYKVVINGYTPHRS